MNIELKVKKATTEFEYGYVELEGVDINEVIEQIGENELLTAIGEENCLAYFGVEKND